MSFSDKNMGHSRPFVVCGVSCVVALGIMPADAADWYTGRKTQEVDYTNNIVIDVSGSMTTQGSRFGDITGTIALDKNLQTTGARVRVEGLAGTYNYRTGNTNLSVAAKKAAQ